MQLLCHHCSAYMNFVVRDFIWLITALMWMCKCGSFRWIWAVLVWSWSWLGLDLPWSCLGLNPSKSWSCLGLNPSKSWSCLGLNTQLSWSRLGLGLGGLLDYNTNVECKLLYLLKLLSGCYLIGTIKPSQHLLLTPIYFIIKLLCTLFPLFRYFLHWKQMSLRSDMWWEKGEEQVQQKMDSNSGWSWLLPMTL